MANASSKLDPRTPVVVGVAQVEQRSEDPTKAREPVALLVDAVRAAANDAGSHRLLATIDTLAVVKILSQRYSDPAELVAEEVGIVPRRRIVTDDGGNYPMTLLNRACSEIAAGASDGWIIGGAEAWRSRTAARAHWPAQDPTATPTEVISNKEPLGHPGEWARKIFMPIEIYPLFENALRAREGWSIDEHRDRLAKLWSGFSDVAAGNPHAWIRRSFAPDELRDANPDNRMVGFPYTKRMNANNAVEQAAAFIVTSVGRARDLGIPSDRWVFPWSGADAHEHWYVSHRWDLAEAPAIRIAGRAALTQAGIGVDDLAHVDVYSCFPSAVQIAAKEIGLGTDRPLTVTGGLSFAGGPWNDYVSHSIAAMVDRLRDDNGTIGLVTGNGGFLTKHSFGVLSTTPPRTPFRHLDAQAEVDAFPRRELCESTGPDDGPVTVETSTVMHDRDGNPERAIVAALLSDGRRVWGSSSESEVMNRFLTVETHGETGTIDSEGTFRPD